MLQDGRGTPSSPPFTGFPHHHSPYHAARRRPSPPGSPSNNRNGSGNNATVAHCCFNNKKDSFARETFFCCCYTCPAPRNSTSVFASIGICFLVVGYTLLGAFTFMTLEGGLSDAFGSKVSASKTDLLLGSDIRSRTVEKLWSITEDLNILYKENWTRLAAQEVLEFQDSLVRALKATGSSGGYVARPGGGTMFYQHHMHRWTFTSSFLYSLTLITTIGYGSVSPRTAWGKIITIVYALIGIPLMLVYLSTMGEVLARNFRRLYARLCGVATSSNKKTPAKCTGVTNSSSSCKPHHNHISDTTTQSKPPHYYQKDDDLAARTTGVILDCGTDALTASNPTVDTKHNPRRSCLCSTHDSIRVPVTLCLILIILYIVGGALLFNRLENWTILEGSYFCFTSLGTIGFGDLIPGSHQKNHKAEEISHCVCSVYILTGMALIAMCFNLVQEEVASVIRTMGKLCGGSGERYYSPCRTMTGDPYYCHHYHHGEEIAMSVVSSSTS